MNVLIELLPEVIKPAYVTYYICNCTMVLIDTLPQFKCTLISHASGHASPLKFHRVVNALALEKDHEFADAAMQYADILADMYVPSHQQLAYPPTSPV